MKRYNEISQYIGNPGVQLELRLEKLEELADLIGNDVNNAKHFNETVLERWVKTKDIELYDSYKAAEAA